MYCRSYFFSAGEDEFPQLLGLCEGQGWNDKGVGIVPRTEKPQFCQAVALVDGPSGKLYMLNASERLNRLLAPEQARFIEHIVVPYSEVAIFGSKPTI